MESLEIILELLQIIEAQQTLEVQQILEALQLELSDQEFHILTEIQVLPTIHTGEQIHLLQVEEIIVSLAAAVEQETTVLEVVPVVTEIIADLLHREVVVRLDHPHLLQEVVAVEPLLQEADHHLDQHPHLQEVVQDVQIDKKN